MAQWKTNAGKLILCTCIGTVVNRWEIFISWVDGTGRKLLNEELDYDLAAYFVITFSNKLHKTQSVA